MVLYIQPHTYIVVIKQPVTLSPTTYFEAISYLQANLVKIKM
jgi:hypothetical protein